MEKGDPGMSDEKIAVTLQARLHSADKRVPKCVCMITATDRRLFVSEENKSGTITDHYVLDLAQVEDVRISRPYKTSTDKTNRSASLEEKIQYDAEVRGGFLFRLIGGGVSGRSRKSKLKFLEIVYKDEEGRPEHLYFDMWDKSPSKLIKYFKNIKKS